MIQIINPILYFGCFLLVDLEAISDPGNPAICITIVPINLSGVQRKKYPKIIANVFISQI